MRVLVTGSSGFIGSHLVEHLERLGYIVAGLDARPQEWTDSAVRLQVNLLDENAVLDAMETFRPDLLFHLAAETGLDATPEAYATNDTGVLNLINAVKAVGSVKRALYTSSQLVCRIGYFPKHETDYRPDTRYGESKVRTECVVREQDGGCPQWCLVRPTTVWGPGMNEHYQNFFRLLKRGMYFHVAGKQLNKTYGYVGNVVHQYIRLAHAEASRVHRRVFYLGDYEPISLRAWINEFVRELDAPRVRDFPGWLVQGAAWIGDTLTLLGFRRFPLNSFRLQNILTEYVYDMSATSAVCGPLPWHWRDGVRETARWLRALG